MESFAEQIKRLRKEKNAPLRTASEKLDIDPAILSKIENGKRIARREIVLKLAKYYKEGYLLPFALNTAKNDLILIYE